MEMTRETYRLIMEEVAPLMVLEAIIRDHAAVKPSAIMLPMSTFPDLEEIYGYPVIRGDRRALLFEPINGGDV